MRGIKDIGVIYMYMAEAMEFRERPRKIFLKTKQLVITVCVVPKSMSSGELNCQGLNLSSATY